MSAPMLASLQSWVSPGRMLMAGWTTPLIVRWVGASELMLAPGIELVASNWKSFSARTRSVIPRRLFGSSGVRPSTSTIPLIPPNTCPSAKGWAWEWNQ